MSRCAFLPSPGDPFVLLHFLKYYQEVWMDEVDKLYILINGDMQKSIADELLKQLRLPKVNVTYYDKTLGHGRAIDLMLDKATEDFVVLLEDDSIIFKKGILDKYFKLLESGEKELIGSPRMSCSKEVADELAWEFNLNYEGWGDKGPNFWPCFLFVSTEYLRRTDRDFGSSEYGDTFVWTSIQLRRMIDKSKILEIPQYHCSPDDEVNKEYERGIFDGECGYMHFGSLSSGIENTLLDEFNRPLKDRHLDNCVPVRPRVPQSIQEHIELERRVIWWQEAVNLNIGDFPEYRYLYRRAIRELIKRNDLKKDRINKFEKMYKEVINGRHQS